ncbi:MAG: S9 family peptidase [Caulobacteraceae bacterium]|nr:S9 family peptidase [Caulobacteraceae bacterium]
MRTFGDVAISPAGDRIAAVETDEPLGPTATRARGPVVVRDARTGAALASYDPCPVCRYSGLAWSPHGEALAFIAFDPDKTEATLDVLRDGRVRVLATVEGVAQTPRFSPDGAQIALMATPGAHKETGAVEAGAEQVGDIGALTVADEKRIGVIPASGGEIRYVSPADTFIYEYDWRPDGRGFVATAAKGNGDNNWWIAKLVAVDLDGSPVRVIAAPTVQMNAPRVSPDGRTVVFIGGLMSDFGSVGGDIYTVPLAGGTPIDVTPGIKASFTSLAGWRGGRLLGTLLRGDRAEIVAIDPRTGEVDTRWSAPGSARAADAQASFSADGSTAAAEVQDFTHPPEIWAGAPGPRFVALTRVNAALSAQTDARSVTWKSDGFEVQGWLLAPLNVTAGKHPMVVDIHGGPSSAVTPRYVPPYDEGIFPVTTWLRKGYFVFYANPRGSYGQGEAFTKANIRDFGGGDLRDIVAGIDKVESIAPVDDARLGVFGHSYGGFMTMWTVTHSHRFAAAIAGAGISDWVSYYGENGIDQWMIPFFGASAYDDPAIYEKASPIFSVKNARTPTLIYVGERDVECPPPQSFEFWRALEAAGVPTSFIVYKGQGHAIRDPSDLADLRERNIAWFDKYLGG